MYLGGNGLNCDVEFLDEATCIYRNEDERRLRVGTAHWAGPESPVEPQPAGQGPVGPTGPTFESRFHLRHESEAALLGVVYDDRGIMTAAPYRVIDSRHWVFAGTGLREGDLFGQKSLHMRVPGGASGHETDKISPSSPANTQLLARGGNPGSGGAEMVLHEPPGGGAVFSAGSIAWPASVLVDQAVSKITANVLRRFVGSAGPAEPRSAG
jgi:hypothetical protein